MPAQDQSRGGRNDDEAHRIHDVVGQASWCGQPVRNRSGELAEARLVQLGGLEPPTS
jgi:hypothetical protein